MSMFRCELCDNLLDGDYVEAYEWGDGMVCGDCHCEATPENWEDWIISYWAKPIPDRSHDWEIVHRDYDGPEDPRAFTGPTLADVWEQAREYEYEANTD